MTRPPRPEYVRLYPEIGQAGSLRNAMQSAFDAAGAELTASLTDAPGWWDCAARVGDATRHANLHLAAEERCVLLDFWDRGVLMATGVTTDLSAAAGAIALWQAGSRLRELRAAWPFVRYGDLAEAYESGDPVEAKWQRCLRTAVPPVDSGLVEAAGAEPKLRALFPFTSHASLHLSRHTRSPFTNDLPVVRCCADGAYEVGWPTASPFGSGIVGRVGTPQEAVALVVAHLPDGYGPAIDNSW